MSTTPASTASASLTSSGSTTATTIASMQTTHMPKVFGSASLLFGFVFLALLIIFMAVGFVWQRVVIGRHRSLMSLVEQVREMEILQSKPVIWDAHVKLLDNRGREAICHWRDFKPLSVQLRPCSEQAISNDVQNQSESSARRSGRPSALRRFLDWLDPRPFYNPLLPSPPPGFELPSSLSQIHPARPRPRANHSGSEKGKDRDRTRDTTMKRIVDRRLSVSVIIAMPTPTSRRGDSATGPFSSSFSIERTPIQITDESQDLHYEIGVTRVPLRVRSSFKSSRTSSKEENGDYDSFLDDLFDDIDGHDHAYPYDDKDNTDYVGLNATRIPQ